MAAPDRRRRPGNSSEGDATRFSVDADHETTGVFGKLVDRVVLHRTRDRAIRQMDESLKALAEAEVPVTS